MRETGKSRDFEEIAVAFALLAGISGLLLKMIDYFNNNVFLISDNFQPLIYTFVWILLVELLFILSYLILKGYLISAKSEKQGLKNLTEYLFKISFELFILWFISIISFLFFYQYIFKYIGTKSYYVVVFMIYVLLSFLIIIIIHIYMMDYKKKDFIELSKMDKKSFLKSYYISLIIGFIFFVLLMPIPSYLLGGSFSIELFPQPNTDNNLLTVIIKETGFSYNVGFITLSKLNADNNSLEPIDNITIPLQNKSFHELMFGGRHRRDFYLNINTSNLSSGNYMISAEVTDDPSRTYIFGVIIKYGDKLFYIPPKSPNYSFNST
ncbi:Uncharacterised protein [uncultured archaeon]|nr:Uncharacterised protein [uncultured archaeon]